MTESQDQKEIGKRRVAVILTWAGIAGGSLLLAAIAALMIAGYVFHLTWTGVVPEPKDPKHGPGKTLWDWLQLLIIPAALAIVGIWFNGRQKQVELEIAQRNRAADREIADRNREADRDIADRNRQADLEKADAQRQDQILATYIDRMQDLLEKSQGAEAPDGTIPQWIRTSAKARTVTAIRQLDSEHNASLLRFLTECGLLEGGGRPVDLSNTDLRGSHLASVDLQSATLQGANLQEATLDSAFLQEATLDSANLQEATLNAAYLRDTTLKAADLDRADLTGASLWGANLTGAILVDANLWGAYLMGANLMGANLWGANLKDASITDDQLKQSHLSRDTTMPDGRKFRGWDGQSYERDVIKQLRAEGKL